MTDAVPLTPGSEGSASELRAAIRDEVFGRGAAARDDTAKKMPDLLGGRLLLEGRDAEDAAREMIEDDRDPPAEGPALRQGERDPGGPEAGHGRHDREIGVPDMIGPPRRDAA